MKDFTYKKCVFYTLLTLFSLVFSLSTCAQIRFYPPNWFQEMYNDTLEVLVHNTNGEIINLELQKFKGVKLLEQKVFKNKKYAALKLYTPNPPKEIKIKVNDTLFSYLFLEKKMGMFSQGFSQADVMYLITPDRFANGDTQNDSLAGFEEKKYGREKPYGRHGGDIQGITNHLDYLKELGVTALWISPVLTNDQPDESYHGYAITNHYEVDPRFGTLNEYQTLVQEMHQRKLKMVKDMVYNHVGTEHFLFKDLPDSSFFNWHDEQLSGYRQTNYRATTVMDPHRSSDDYEQFQNGWFVRHMPDLNQQNPHVARFLTQNTLWWIAQAGIDAIRIDTYIYPDQKFMAKLAKEVKQAFPGFFIFGETWVHGQPVQSYFVEQMRYNTLNTEMDAVTDFQMYYALNEAVNNKQGWTEGVSKIYYALAADYLYKDPTKLVTFLDNHDLARFAGTVGDDFRKITLGYNWLLTLRGIPCIYYGSEIGMNKMENHGLLRQDFPGGWESDTLNAFTKKGRNPAQDSVYMYLKNALQWRAKSSAIANGKLTQFVPVDGVYVYFRHSEKETVMVIANTNEEAVEHNLTRYAELWPIGSKGKNVLNGALVTGQTLNIPAKTSFIIELK